MIKFTSIFKKESVSTGAFCQKSKCFTHLTPCHFMWLFSNINLETSTFQNLPTIGTGVKQNISTLCDKLKFINKKKSYSVKLRSHKNVYNEPVYSPQKNVKRYTHSTLLSFRRQMQGFIMIKLLDTWSRHTQRLSLGLNLIYINWWKTEKHILLSSEVIFLIHLHY